MRIELPLPVSPAATKGAGGFWQPVELEPDEPSEPGDDAEPAEPAARYFERHDPQDPAAARCLLIVSPLLPLPRSLPSLLQEALTGEPDFRLDWKWPLLTPRVGPWELVVQMCVGTSQAAGVTTGRLYVALDAGFGAYLLVCIDRDPQKLAERQKELLALLAGARLHRARVPAAERPDDRQDDRDPEGEAGGENFSPRATASTTDIVPPQLPPPELYLKETLFSYLTD